MVDENNHSVQNAAVTLNEISNGKSVHRFTDNHGSVNLKNFTYPVYIQIHHLGYFDLNDTLHDATTKSILQLKSNAVNLKTISVTGSYAPSVADKSVYKVDVITREQIDHQAANNLENLLSQQVNMRIERDQSLGSSLLLQGMSGSNIKFLVDGVPVIGRKYGFIDLSQLNLNNIDHIEIVKGSMSVLYGTDAAGGVINLITKNNEKDKLNGGISTYYENIGQYNADMYAGWKFKKTDVRISGGRNFFDGWSKVDTNARSFDWKPKEQYVGNVKLSQHFNRLRLTLQSDYMHDKVIDKSEVRGLPYDAYGLDEYNITTRFNNQLYAELPINSNLNMNFTGAYSFYEARKNKYVKDLVDLSQELSSNPTDHDTTRFYTAFARYVFNRAKTEGIFNYELGLELNNERGTGKRIDDGKIHAIGDYSVFASIEYKPVKALTIRPGVRYAYNTSYKAPVIPSLHILYDISRQITWRASYGRGFRAPGLKELYLSFHDSNHNIDGNQALNAETSHYMETSAVWKFLKEKYLIRVEPSVFYNVVRDKIALAEKGSSSDNYFTYLNVEKFISNGAELQAHFTMKNFHFNAGYNYTGVYNTFYGTTGTTDFAWSPSINASLDYTYPKTNTTLAIFTKFNGKQPVYLIQSDNSLQRYINDDYTLVEINISQRFYKERLIVQGGVMNLLDVTNVKTYSTATAHSSNSTDALVGMGRSLFLKLQLHF